MRIKNFSDAKSILFENLTVKQTLFKNTFWMAVAQVIDKFLRLVLLIYVARILGATEYGKFAFSLAFVTLFLVFFGLGINQIITRDFAQDKEKEREFSALLSLKVILGLVTVLVIWLGSFFITGDPMVQKIILILATFIFFETFCNTIYSFFQARQKMEYHSWTQILENVLITGLGLLVIFNFPSIENLAYSYLFSILIVFMVVLAILHFKIQPISIVWDMNVWNRFLKLSWPLALVAAFYYIHNHIDSVMMGYFGQITQTGWYNAAYGIAAAALIPMGLITTNFYPVLSKVLKESRQGFQRVWGYQMELIIIFVLPLVVGGVILAPKIIDFLYGQEFIPSVLALKILLVMTGIVFIYSVFQKSLIIFNQQKKIFQTMLAGVIVNVGLNIVLIPKYSLYGAAVATVITHLLILFLQLRFILKIGEINLFDSRIIQTFLGAIICSVAMYFIISLPLIYSLPVALTIFIGAVSYFILLWMYKKTVNKFFRIISV